MTKTDAEWQAWQHDWDGPVLSSRAIRCLMKARITSRSQLRDALVNRPNLLRWTPGIGNATPVRPWPRASGSRGIGRYRK